METTEILEILEDKMKLSFIASVDEDGKPHNRPIFIGMANEDGLFFMTNEETDFYQQIEQNPNVALTMYHEDGYLIQLIRVEGLVRKLDRSLFEDVTKENPYLKHVYPEESQQDGSHVFQVYTGKGVYRSLTQGHEYRFEIGQKEADVDF